MTSLIINRIDQSDGMIRSWNLFIDDEFVGKIKYLEQKSYTLEPGKHSVKVSMFPYKSDVIEINVNNENTSLIFICGFIYKNIFQSLHFNALKILPEKEFLKLYSNEPEQEFKKRIEHNLLIGLSGLSIGLSLLFLVFQKEALFIDRGMSFLFALALSIGAIFFLNKKWIISKSFYLNKPLYDGLTILWLTIFQFSDAVFQIFGFIISFCFLFIWLCIKKFYK